MAAARSKAYFRTFNRIQKLGRVAVRIEGTPFVDYGAIIGAGLDCVGVLQAAWAEFGFWEVIDLPQYPIDLTDHSSESVVLEAFETNPAFEGRFERIDLESVGVDERAALVRPGDALCLMVGHAVHHLGLAINEQDVLQTLRCEQGAHRVPLRTYKFLRRVVRLYRPLEK